MRNVSEKPRSVFLCETPLHLLNSVNLVLHDKTFVNTDAELAVVLHDDQMVRFLGCAQASGLFIRVYGVRPYKSNGNMLFCKCYMMLAMLFPKWALSRRTTETLLKSCERIILFSPSRYAIQLSLLYKHAALFVVDEGVGSYYGDIAARMCSAAAVVLGKMLGSPLLRKDVEKLFLYTPSLYRGSYCAPIAPVPPLNNERAKKLAKIFKSDSADILTAYTGIYFTQPVVSKSFEELQGCILDSLAPESTALRVHPQDKDFSTTAGLAQVNGGIWELLAATEILDSHLLISTFSTAAIMPKILVDREPYLIFTYRMFPSGMVHPDFQDWMKVFCESYRDKDKIFFPETLSQLKDYLCLINNRRNRKHTP